MACLASLVSCSGGLSAQDAGTKEGRGVGTTARPYAPGAIEGIVTFEGDIPKSSLANEAGIRPDLVEVDNATRGLRFVVAYLTPMSPSTTRTADNPARRSRVDQQDHAFTPRVIAVQAGEPVVFTNSDPANHNVRTSATIGSNVFNVFTAAGGSYEHRFQVEPESWPVRLGCDIHPWMRGWVYVFDHPHFAVTDERGFFRIRSIPPGDYKLFLRQPDIRYAVARNVSVPSGTAATVALTIHAEEVKRNDNAPDP
jgi:plastocyanin